MDPTLLAFLIFIAACSAGALLVAILLWLRKPGAGSAELREAAAEGIAESRRVESALRDELARGRSEAAQMLAAAREEIGATILRGNELLGAKQEDTRRELEAKLDGRLESVRRTLDERLDELAKLNERKLEEMRKTVDEKLESTLEKRLGESFRLVGERLEQVHKGLGEMQSIAAGVGDLKKVLTNVKTRGTWGEIQLGSLLEQMLTPDQFCANFAPRPRSAERVEFAIRLPGRGAEDEPVWLPIDAKFPVEDFQRLIDASERADAEALAAASRALENRVRDQAREIASKYIAPPLTTDFALLYLPSEALYAEVLRRPGLAEELQRQHRVALAGPMTLTAILNSLQMGFRTLAIQKRSGEVWNILGAVKAEFGKFGDMLERVKRQLEAASNTLEQTGARTRQIERKLRGVEALPSAEAGKLLPEEDAAEDMDHSGSPPTP